MRISFLQLALIVGVASPLLACGSAASSGGEDGGTDSSTNADGGGRDASPQDSSAGDANAESCLTLPQPAADVSATAAAGAMPAAEGGAIVNGTYRLVATKLYGGATLPYPEGSLTRINAGTYQESVVTGSNGAWRTGKYALTVDSSAKLLSLGSCLCAEFCVLSGTSGSYTATPTELRTFSTGENGAGYERISTLE